MENTFTTTQPVDQPLRILALDFGARNMGLAVSDELGVTAQGLPTLRRSNKRNDFDHLRRVIKQFHVTEIVMGLPLRMSGDEGTQAERVQVFAEELRRKFKLPVNLFDERLTSVEANRLLRETDMSIRQRAGAVDQMAAVLILQSFLEYSEKQNPVARIRSGSQTLLRRRNTPGRPSMPEPISMMLLGSGVALGPPYTVNDSDGIVPMAPLSAWDGQPGEVQPTPEFSSQ